MVSKMNEATPLLGASLLGREFQRSDGHSGEAVIHLYAENETIYAAIREREKS